MNKIYLIETPKDGAALYCCRQEDIDTSKLPQGSRVWELGIANRETPPIRIATMEHIAHITPRGKLVFGVKDF